MAWPPASVRGHFVLSERLPRGRRIQANRDFREAYGQGRDAHGRFMVLFRRAGAGACGRLGVVASKRVGGSPERARAKRRLREVFRRHLPPECRLGDDLVLVARRPILTAPWSAVVAEFLRLLERSAAAAPAVPVPGEDAP